MHSHSQNVRIECWRCLGSGTALEDYGGENPCAYCDGNGYIVTATVNLDEPMTRTYRILEVLDKAEYLALTQGNQKTLDLILACGIIDLSTGSPLRITLEDMFPSGNTRDGLEYLWSEA